MFRFAFFFCVPQVCTLEGVQRAAALIQAKCLATRLADYTPPFPEAIIAHPDHEEVLDLFRSQFPIRRHLCMRQFYLAPPGEVWRAREVILGATASTLDPKTGIETILYLGDYRFFSQLLREMRRCSPGDERFNFDEGDVIMVPFLADSHPSQVRTTNHERLNAA